MQASIVIISCPPLFKEFLLFSWGSWLLSVRPHLTWGRLRIQMYHVELFNSQLKMNDAGIFVEKFLLSNTSSIFVFWVQK